jgi:hypothetical protein
MIQYNLVDMEDLDRGLPYMFIVLEVKDLEDPILFKRFRGKKPDVLYLPKRKLWNFLRHENLKHAMGSFMVGGCISKTDLKTFLDVNEIETEGYKISYQTK